MKKNHFSRTNELLELVRVKSDKASSTLGRKDFYMTLSHEEIVVTHFNDLKYQVENGGFKQWVANYFAIPSTFHFIRETLRAFEQNHGVKELRSYIDELQIIVDDFQAQTDYALWDQNLDVHEDLTIKANNRITKYDKKYYAVVDDISHAIEKYLVSLIEDSPLAQAKKVILDDIYRMIAGREHKISRWKRDLDRNLLVSMEDASTPIQAQSDIDVLERLYSFVQYRTEPDVAIKDIEFEVYQAAQNVSMHMSTSFMYNAIRMSLSKSWTANWLKSNGCIGQSVRHFFQLMKETQEGREHDDV